MAKNKLRIMTQNLLSELNEHSDRSVFNDYILVKSRILEAKFKNILTLAKKQIPALEVFVETLNRKYHPQFDEAIQSCTYILEILDIEDAIEKDIEKGDIFQGAKDKLKEASLCFKREDYSGTINNLNTCLELLLKEKFNIPTTIKRINTAKIIEIAIKYKVGPIKYFGEVKKHVLDMDNQIKHIGYTPSKIECIFAIKSMEELCQNLEGYPLTLTDEITKKIYSGI